jgi:protein involved in polysaccharide export with SLBB domain
MNYSKFFLVFLSFFFLSHLIYAQDRLPLTGFDEDFIAGLPQSSRDQLELNENVQEDEELTQLYNADSSLANTKAILKNLRDQINNIEQTISPKASPGTDQSLEIFGSYFFQNIQSTFMPVNVANLGDEYFLDAGDELEIMLTGRTSRTSTQMINRDGSILLQGIGKISIAGKNFSEAQELVSEFVESVSIGTKAYMSLSKIRDIQVLVTGSVKAPGIYTISGNSNVLGAINNAGGMKTNGSFRKVDLLRKGNVIKTFDLYDLIAFGAFDATLTLRAGDSIFIHPISFHVPVSGGINNPGIFEIIPGESIKDVIKFAGNFSQAHHGYDYVMLERMSLEGFENIKVNLDQVDKLSLKPRDILKIPHFYPHSTALKRVTIEGEVKQPGTYFLEKNESLSELISRAGGYKANAYIYGAALFRKSASEQEKIFAQRNYADTVAYIVSNIGKPNTTIASDTINFLNEEIKAKNFVGRIIADFDMNTIRRSPAKDLALENQDRLVIPAMQKVLYMFGDFSNPTTATYDSSLSIKDYIKMSGGLKDSASTQLLVIDPDGKTNIYNANRWSFASSIALYPGSIIYASRDIGEINGVVYASAVAPILSSVALSLASLNAINN